jgi:hypothetical protein
MLSSEKKSRSKGLKRETTQKEKPKERRTMVKKRDVGLR